MCAQQRAQMAVDHLGSDPVLLPLTERQKSATRTDGDRQENRGRISKPTRGTQRRGAACRGFPAKGKADLRAERWRSAIDRGCLADLIAQALQCGRFRAAIGAAREMVA